jgi:hypothetical protein
MTIVTGWASNYDLFVDEALVGAKVGFDDLLASSHWPSGEGDYVLVNLNVSPSRPYDVGVLNYQGTDDYFVEAVESVILDAAIPHGAYGPFDMPDARTLHLWDMFLQAGLCAIRLDNLAGTVDWGLTLHPADLVYQAKDTAVDGGIAWTNGPGQAEWITVQVPVSGWYCLAVWKRSVDDLFLPGTYFLRIVPDVTDVPDGGAPPAATALREVRPNPFNPRTTVAFDLARTGPVVLAVHDPRGARVCTLVDRELPAGRHEAVWDGRDDNGRRVASGVYLARLTAAGVRDMTKMVMLK